MVYVSYQIPVNTIDPFYLSVKKEEIDQAVQQVK